MKKNPEKIIFDCLSEELDIEEDISAFSKALMENYDDLEEGRGRLVGLQYEKHIRELAEKLLEMEGREEKKKEKFLRIMQYIEKMVADDQYVLPPEAVRKINGIFVGFDGLKSKPGTEKRWDEKIDILKAALRNVDDELRDLPPEDEDDGKVEIDGETPEEFVARRRRERALEQEKMRQELEQGQEKKN